MNENDLRKIQKKLPLSAATLARNAGGETPQGKTLCEVFAEEERKMNDNLSVSSQGISPGQPQLPQGEALGRRVPRKKASRPSYGVRYRIVFTVYACQPLDWDNISIKQLQDVIRAVGLIPDDNWEVLEGCCISQKAYKKSEERTEICLERIL